MRSISSGTESPNGRALWLPALLVALAVGLRAVKSTEMGADWLPNFSPWMALAFAGTLLFPKAMPWWGVVAVMVGLDVIVQGSVIMAYPGTMGLVYGCFALAAFAGSRFRGRVGGLGVVWGSVVCSLGFYLVTNTLSWLVMPEYARLVAGWVQALTTGLPGFPPTWTFLRNSLLSDAGFGLLLVLACQMEAAGRQLPRLGWVRAEA